MEKIKNFIKDNKKVLLLAVFLLVFVTACTNVRNADGTIDPEKLITLKTTFGSSLSEGWFNIFVWPIAQMINFVASFTDAGIGIIVVTVLVNLVIMVFSIKQQVATQKMQMIQPEITKIQAKYAGKNDQQSQMKQAQELQRVYDKHGINPFGTLVTTFIQLPVIFAIYQAVMRAESVYDGKFLGMSLSNTPLEAFSASEWMGVVIFILMILAQFLSVQMSKILKKQNDKKNKVKTKEYAKSKNDDAMGNMDQMNIMMVAMIAVFAIGWPLGMSFYWLVSSVVRIVQNIVINKYFINK